METRAKLSRNPLRWLAEYVRQSKEELGKVTWPSRKEVVKYSALVGGISIALAAFFGGLDWLFQLGLEELVSLVS